MTLTRRFWNSLRRGAIACATLAIAQVMTASLALGLGLTHGPVVGGVTASNAKVFVRTQQAARVSLRYSASPSFDTFQVSKAFTTNVASDFTEIIPLSELSAETTYYLDVLVNGVPQLTSPYPSFATFPPPRTSRSFSFVVLTDFTTVHNLTAGVETFASAAATNPVFSFIGGDFDHRQPVSIRNKRQMFKDLYDDRTPFMGDFVDLILRRMPIIHQWDDHDAGANNIDKTYSEWADSQEAFEEYMPSYRLPPGGPGIWQTFSYAQADCFVLDCRSQRDPETDPDDTNKSMLDGNTLGARGQLQWLETSLRKSMAEWKIIFTSVVTNPTTKFPDGWAGYQTEWNSLKNFINTNNIGGVIFISGDLHLGAIDDGTQAGFPEMCVSQPNGTGGCPTDAAGEWSEGYYDDPTCKGFGLVTISSDPDQLTLQTMDEFGNSQISYTISGTPSR